MKSFIKVLPDLTALAKLISSIFIEYVRFDPDSGPLHLLILLSRMFIPQKDR